MAFTRIYALKAAAGRCEEFQSLLGELGAIIAGLNDCTGVELMRDASQTSQFLFIERWASQEAHRSSADAMPVELLRTLMTLLAEAPRISCYHGVPSQ